MLLHGTSKKHPLIILRLRHTMIILFKTYFCSYYESGESAVLPDFFNPEVLDRFLYAAQKIVSETLEHDPNKELWLGETSSCYDGGSPELSASYVAGFMQVLTTIAIKNLI